MLNLKYFSADAETTSEKSYNIPVLEGDKGVQALKQVVLAQMANRRQGSANTQTRGTIHGTGKKPFRQKGTGMARQGTRVGPQHYHGAVAFGPKPRDWSQRINKKMKRLAFHRAFFERAMAGDVYVIEKWQLPECKTKLFAGLMDKIEPTGKVLVVDDSWSDHSVLAARNIERLTINEAAQLSVLDLTKYRRIVVSEKGMDCLMARLNGGDVA